MTKEFSKRPCGAREFSHNAGKNIIDANRDAQMTTAKREWEQAQKSTDQDGNGLSEVLTSRRAQFALLLYFLFPLFAGFISAMQGSGRTADWPIGYRLAYYLPLALVVMWTSGIATYALAKPARKIRVPLWLVLIAGVLVAGEFIKLYVQTIVPVFDKLLPESAIGGRVVEFNFMTTLLTGLPTIATWLCLNLLAWKVFAIPRFGYEAPDGVISSRWSRSGDWQLGASKLPPFLRRAKIVSVADVEAIEAQQHYIQIHCRTGNTRTILYRFGDAIVELEDTQGMQVHRSWWVNSAYAMQLQRDGERTTVVLESGMEVPVSRSFARQARQMFG